MPAVYFEFRNWLEGTYTLRILDGCVDLFVKIGPYVLVSIVISVAVTRFFRTRKKLLFPARNELLAIVSAAAVGLVSPLPTYAAIPVGLSLIPAGIPFSAVLAFAIASPLINPSVFYLTAARLGLEMALIRTIVAFVIGCAGGVLVMTVFRSLRKEDVPAPFLQPPVERTLWTDIRRTSLYTGKVFGIAILISAAVKALVPAQTIVNLAGEHAATGTLVAMGLGVPFYSCGGAAIPFMETLMDMGMGKGPVLAFFIAGPATKLETIYAFRSTMGMKVLFLYLGLTLACAFAAGSMYSLF